MLLRNRLCECGSGKRFKHCHGAPQAAHDPHSEFTDQRLIAVLKRADDEGLRLGEEPPARYFQNIIRALGELGCEGVVLIGRGTPPVVERAHKLNNMLFVPKERQAGGLHLGAFLFRDMFCTIYAPLAFGECKIDFWTMLDLSEFQKAWLSESADDLARFSDQATDILDFGYGWQEFGRGGNKNVRAKDLIWRSHVQLEAAAATATAAYDFRGTVQSALLGTELALKAGLAALGMSDAELSNRNKVGHDLVSAAIHLGDRCSTFDVERVLRVVRTFPDFVESRYKLPAPSRTETGHIIMGAQYVASEVTRQFSDRDSRRHNAEMPQRSYPA